MAEEDWPRIPPLVLPPLASPPGGNHGIPFLVGSNSTEFHPMTEKSRPRKRPPPVIPSGAELVFITGDTSVGMKSMTKIRKKAMDSYLKTAVEGSRKRDSLQGRTKVRSDSMPLDSINSGATDEQEREQRKVGNRIAQQNYRKNFEFRFEELKSNKLWEPSESENPNSSDTDVSTSSSKTKQRLWAEESQEAFTQGPKENSSSEETQAKNVWGKHCPNGCRGLFRRMHDIKRHLKQCPNREPPPCNTLYIGNLPLNALQDGLKSLFMRFGYTRICFSPNNNTLMCFIEFEDTKAATLALKYCQGYPLVDNTKEGIRLSYSRTPLVVGRKSATGDAIIEPLQAQSEESHRIMNCACGQTGEEEHMFQCVECGGWQHVSCYDSLIQTEGEIHDCLNCMQSSKSRSDEWAKVKDLSERRKVRNKLGQRRFRDKVKEQKEDIERSYASPEPENIDTSQNLSSLPWGNISLKHTTEGKNWSKMNSPESFLHPKNMGWIRDKAVGRAGEMSRLERDFHSNKLQQSVETEAHGSSRRSISAAGEPSMSGKDIESPAPLIKIEDETDEESTAKECPCGCAVQDVLQSQMLPELRTELKENWNQVQKQLPDDWKWDTEYDDECWTCTPLETTKPGTYPLTIAGAPVVLPVEYHWPPIGGVNPPPDPRPAALIDHRVAMPLDVVRDLFLTFEGSLGFYALINGLLQVIVPKDFDTNWASSHLPHKYGGMKVCYIPQTIEPTMQPSMTQIADTNPGASSSTPDAINLHWPGRSLHSSWNDSLKLNDFVEARPKSRSRKEKYSGRIGLKVIKDGSPYLVMSTHVITEAILAKSHLESIFGSTRDRFDKLSGDWNEYVEMWAGNEKIGIVQKSFDAGVENYPNGFSHDVTLIKPTTPTSIRDIRSPLPNLGWLNRESWNSLRQQASSVKILASTENHRSSKSIKCSRLSDILIVGEGILLNQTASMSRTKSLKDHDASTWRDLVSRAVLYRVFPDFDPPNGYSGIALYADGTREDGTEGPGVVGFQSFVQRSGHVQNFEMEGAPLEQRMKLGRVAFYGAFEVPAELKSYTIV